MFVELLEKFEDVFKPLPPEEAEKRYPFYSVTLTKYSLADYPKVSSNKKFKIKSSFQQLKQKVAEELGLRSDRFSPNPAANLIHITSSDGVKGDDGNLMHGWYYIYYEEIDQ